MGGAAKSVNIGCAALVAGLALASTLVARAEAAEICRYTGRADHSGQLAVRTEVTAAGGAVTVDVTFALATNVWFFDVQYLAEEISTWRAGELQNLAVNTRYGVDGRMRRQQWDVFVRTPDGLEARRVQAKTLADLRRRHPLFATHWDPATFGQPWLQDYAGALPERRPDLDLPRQAAPSDLRTPLALAFYWSRWLPSGGEDVPVFLPGFKRDARLDFAVGAAASGDGWRSWQAPLRHVGLSATVPSTAGVWVSQDGHLLQLAFDVHARQGSARGVIRAQGCQGVAITPAVTMQR